MSTDRALAKAAAANLIARECLAVTDRQRREALAELEEIGDVLASKTERAIELFDAIDQINEDSLRAAEIVCRTEEAAREHAKVAAAKQEIAKFVAEREAARRVA